MANVQEIFDRIQKTKKELRELKNMYRDALLNSGAHKNVSEELKALREKKKKIEEGIRDDFRSEFEKMEILKADIENDSALLSDAALSQYVKGQGLDIKDEYEHKYEPIFRVQFKKI